MDRKIWMGRTKIEWLKLLALAVIAVLSLTLFRAAFSNPGTYRGVIQKIDQKKQEAMALSATVTIASTLVTTLPDDTATPIADELSELSTPLLLSVCMLYLEKYLLTIFGWAACTFLIPLACACAAWSVWKHRDICTPWFRKCLILALALLLVIPTSVQVTTMIEDTFSESMQATYEAALKLAEETEKPEDQNAIVAFFTSIKDNVTALLEGAKDMLSILVDAVAVLIVTSCVIPLLTAIVFVWMVKVIMGSSLVSADFTSYLSTNIKKLQKVAEEPKDIAA